MISDRAWYLAAAGVLAFGLSHSLLNCGAEWVSQVSNRTLARVEQVSMGATDYLGTAQLMLGKDDVLFNPGQVRIALAKGTSACSRNQLIRHKRETTRLRVMTAVSVLGEQ